LIYVAKYTNQINKNNFIFYIIVKYFSKFIDIYNISIMNPSFLQLFQNTYSPILRFYRNYPEPSNNEDDLSIAQPSSRIEETAIFRHLTARKDWHGFPRPWILQIIISIFPLISHAFPSHRIPTFSSNLVRRERLMIHLVRAT